MSTIYISDISFQSDLQEELDSKQFEELLSLKVGANLDIASLMADVERLTSELKETYPNIEMQINPDSNGGVSILFELQKNRRVKRLIVRAGDLNPSDLRAMLLTRKGELLRGTTVKADQNTITTYYHNRGYPFVRVTPVISLVANTKEVEVLFNVKLNSKELIISKIKFTGLSHFKKKTLKNSMKLKQKTFFSSKVPLSLESLTADLLTLKNKYVVVGFMKTIVSYKLEVDKKKSHLVNIIITINEGRRSKISKITLMGNLAFSNKVISSVMELSAPSAFNLQHQKKALQNIRDLYGMNGYVLSQVQMKYDEENETINVDIIEGKIQSILKIQIIGNTQTKNKAILETLRFNTGDVVSTIKIRESIKKLYKTGIYKDVGIEYIPMTQKEGKIVVKVIENSTRVIQFSLGSISGRAGVGTSLNDINLFGTGNSLSISGMLSKELSRLSLIYKDPHLFGSDYELVASFNQDLERNYYYNQKKTAIVLMVEKQLSKNLKLGLGTRLEFVDPKGILESFVKTIDLSETRRVVSGLISSFAYSVEKRDQEGQLSSGTSVTLQMLPSFVDQAFFFKSVASFNTFKDVGRNAYGSAHKISGRITLGHTTSKTPFFEKFQGGGLSTIRGFEQGSIAGLDGELGANSSVSANVTYSFPLYKDSLSGVLFMDAFVLGDSKMNMGEIRLVGGLGVRAHVKSNFISETFEAGITIPFYKRAGDITKPFYFIFGDYDPAYNL